LDIVKSLAQRRLLVVAIFAGIFVASCVPIRMEASWPALGVIGDEQSIYVAYNDRLVLINPVDGTPLKLRNQDGEVRLDEQGNARIWEFTGPEGSQVQFYSAPVVVDNSRLLIASYNERLFEVGLVTARSDTNISGIELPGPVIADPVLNADENLLYLGISERDLVAVTPANGAEQWRVSTEHGVWSEPLVVDDILYFTSLDHQLYALDARTGEVSWTLDLQGAAPETPLFYEDRLYVGSFARKLFEISLEGEILSEFKTTDWVWSAPTIVDDVLYAGDLSGTVYALDVSDGGFRQLWQADVASKAIRTTPLVSNEYVVVGSRDQNVYWLSRANGSTFFARPVGGEVLSDIVLIEPGGGISEPMVVVGTPNYQELLVAFTLQNGERVWSYGR
jgi:outer membrane protein assembly factor BamB